MRTWPIFFVPLGLLGVIVHVSGATSPLRDKVETLLADPAIVAKSPEVKAAKAEAKAALAQADAIRASKKEDAEPIAAALDETAFEWAQLSKELSELGQLQAQADAAEQRQVELEAQLKREKAHLEETEARRGRALAALKKLGENVEATEPPRAGQIEEAR